jgi:hypothetical protein
VIRLQRNGRRFVLFIEETAMPATTIKPQTVAEKIIKACGQGHTGLLDIL